MSTHTRWSIVLVLVQMIFWSIIVCCVAHAGVLTTREELLQFKAAALAGTEPYATRRTQLLADADDAWAWGTVSGAFTGDSSLCINTGTGNTDYLKEGAPDALAQVVGAVLTTDPALKAAWAAEARAHLLDLTDTTYPETYSGGNQCILELSISLPVWIETAELLKEVAGYNWRTGTVWSAADEAAFETWLAYVYKFPAWASRVRRNNWGAAGSLSATLIARYLYAVGANLIEVPPGPPSSPTTTARSAHTTLQMDRINTIWQGDSQCLIWGIQSHGGIPDELRRGTSGCTANHLLAADESLTYQTMHVEFLIFHALAQWRSGLRTMLDSQTQAILRAVRFVIANPNGSQIWDPNHFGGLIGAALLYDDAATDSAAQATTTFRGGRNMPYMRVFAPFCVNCSGGSGVGASVGTSLNTWQPGNTWAPGNFWQ